MGEYEGRTSQEYKIHSLRLAYLVRKGIISLVLEVGAQGMSDYTGVGIDCSFRGDPVVRVKASRQKQEEDMFYREQITLQYDGETLAINGLHTAFSASIPDNDKECLELIGGGLKSAFDNPVRTIILDFNPRKLY